MDDRTLVGQKLGNYEVTLIIGRGGMGTVYLAEHPRIGRKVAVKVMSPSFTQHPQAAERFEAEARLITRVEHPGVIEIYDFGSLEDGSLYYVMELLEGRELTDLLQRRGKLEARELVPYVEQLCAALQAAHDMGVVHRDLKPENIFILDREPLALKILDFGIAKLVEGDESPEGSLTQTGMIMGTPLFIAPEQAAGEPQRISPQTDIYSLGAMLYLLLSGAPPFPRAAVGRLLVSHIHDTPPRLEERVPEVPVAVAEVVHRCLEKDPADRPASALELARAFTGAALGPVASEPTAGAPQPPEQPTAALQKARRTGLLPDGPAVEPAEAVPQAPPPGPKNGGDNRSMAVTTLGGATGQVDEAGATEAPIPTNRAGKVVALAAAMALGLGGTLFVVWGQSAETEAEGEAQAPAAVSAAAPPKLASRAAGAPALDNSQMARTGRSAPDAASPPEASSRSDARPRPDGGARPDAPRDATRPDVTAPARAAASAGRSAGAKKTPSRRPRATPTRPPPRTDPQQKRSPARTKKPVRPKKLPSDEEARRRLLEDVL